jgi:hypothetical protein
VVTDVIEGQYKHPMGTPAPAAAAERPARYNAPSEGEAPRMPGGFGIEVERH